jgi:hypothetical protein
MQGHEHRRPISLAYIGGSMYISTAGEMPKVRGPEILREESIRVRYFFFFLAVFLAFFAFFAFFAMLPSMIPNDELTARLGISVRTSSVHHNC